MDVTPYDGLGWSVPDALGIVVETFDMGTIVAAQRLLSVDQMRREALKAAASDGRMLTDVVERGIRLELAAALRVTEYAAGSMIAFADALVTRYPDVLDALLAARMTEQHADILVTGLDAVEPELRDRLLPDAVALAEVEPVGSFRRSLRKLIDTARTATLAERHADAVKRRRVIVEPDADGMGWLHLYGPVVELHAIHDRATKIAKVLIAQECDDRTLDQARADVICDLLIDGTTPTHPPAARGIRAAVVVTVPALALLAVDDAEREAAGHAPAVVEGVGPIPIGIAKELVGTATGMMRVLTHPETGMILSVGRTRYRPPPELRQLVKWRSGRCMAPGCGVPAERCDIDHNLAWEHGGPTTLTNLCPLCRGHHMVKHHTDWHVTAMPDGSVKWVSPAGRTYIVQPEHRIPAFRSMDAADAPF